MISEKVKKRVNISIIADSTAIFRPKEGFLWKDVYPGMLAFDSVFVVQDKSIRSADTHDFLEEGTLDDSIRYANSDYFIIHLGICDVTPRLFTKGQKLFMKLFGQFSILNKIFNIVIKYKSKRRIVITKKNKYQHIPLNEFKINIKTIIREIIENNKHLKKIFVINIVYPGNYMKERNYGISDEILKYNNELNALCLEHQNVCQLIDIYSFTKKNPRVVLADGHHLNTEGHLFIYNEIQRYIES
jgi:lysophospholipase L1-like esterase